MQLQKRARNVVQYFSVFGHWSLVIESARFFPGNGFCNGFGNKVYG